MAAESTLFKFLRPSLRPQSTDMSAAVMWGVAATTTAIWLVQVKISAFFPILYLLLFSFGIEFGSLVIDLCPFGAFPDLFLDWILGVLQFVLILVDLVGIFRL